MAAILFFIGCPKSTESQSDKWFPGYNFNLPIAVVAILFFVEGPKSIASKVSPVYIKTIYQHVKSIRQADLKLLRLQAIFCIGFNVNLLTGVEALLIFVEFPKSIASKLLVV